MMMDFHTSQAQARSDAYTDLSSINAIRTLAREDKNQALEKIAHQFESMMLQMMMKSMRSANEVFGKDSLFNSHQMETYQQMYDDQLTMNLSQGRGIGIAEVMVRQLQGRFGQAEHAELSATNTSTDVIPRYQSVAAGAVTENYWQKAVTSLKETAETVASEIVAFTGDAKSFVEKLYPYAEKAARQLGVSPELLLAQSALETGWGKKMIQHKSGNPSCNLFNIKADERWQGDAITVSTLEIKQGLPVREMAQFRAYPTLADSFDDYVAFIQEGGRYQSARQPRDDATYIQGISEAGYATDPDYAEKVLRIVNSERLQQAVQDYKQQAGQG